MTDDDNKITDLTLERMKRDGVCITEKEWKRIEKQIERYAQRVEKRFWSTVPVELDVAVYALVKVAGRILGRDCANRMDEVNHEILETDIRACQKSFELEARRVFSEQKVKQP